MSSGSTRSLDGMLEINIILLGADSTRFREGASAPSLPSVFLTSRQTAPFLTLIYYRKPCIYRAVAGSSRLLPLARKEPDYSCFRLLSALEAGYCRLRPPFDCCLPAAAHSRAFITRAGCLGCTTWRVLLPRLCLGNWSYPTLWFPRRR